ncbi:MAG: DoxX family protein [Chryseolinea sp.]
MKKLTLIIYWAARIIAALILFQTLFFKFSASTESVYIFTKVGMEPWGRIGIGIFELIASVLLLITATAWIGAALALGLMVGAIGMHLTILGIAVQGDGGYLFGLAVTVAVCSAFILYKNRERIIAIISGLRHRVS